MYQICHFSQVFSPKNFGPLNIDHRIPMFPDTLPPKLLPTYFSQTFHKCMKNIKRKKVF